MTDAATIERLWGLPGAEVLHLDPITAYEVEIDPYYEPERDGITGAKLEEWTVKPAIEHLPKADDLLDWVHERTCEFGEVDEGYCDHFEKITQRPEVVAQAEQLLAAIASQVTYRMADELVATHDITWDSDRGVVLIDGHPLYPSDAEEAS